MSDLEYCTGLEPDGESDVRYEHGTTVRNIPVRIRIRFNSYQHQSTAKAECWSQKDLCWNEIASMTSGTGWHVSPYADHEKIMDSVEEVEGELMSRVIATLG